MSNSRGCEACGTKHRRKHRNVAQALQHHLARACRPRLRLARNAFSSRKRRPVRELRDVLRVCQGVGMLDKISEAVDPYETDLGRIRADQALPQRVRKPK